MSSGFFTKKEFLLFLVFVVTGFLFHALPVTRELNIKGLDIFFSQRAPDPRIAIVAIDNKSIGELGRWPWERSVHARLLEALGDARPKAVGYDVVFAEPSRAEEDIKLAQAVQKAPFPVVFAAELISLKNSSVPHRVLLPLPEFTEPDNAFFAFVNVGDPSADGLARYVPRSIMVGEMAAYPFSRVLANIVDKGLEEQRGTYAISFAGPAGSYPTYSASDVISGRIPESLLHGKIILVGATASDLRDTLPVPFANPVMAGVEWHANVLDTILNERARYVVPSAIATIWGILLASGLFFSALRVAPRRSAAAAASVFFLLPLASYLLWENGIAFYFAGNMLFAGAVFGGASLLRWHRSDVEKKKLRERFTNYFSPHVLEAIVRDPKHLSLGGEYREVTVFFSDIRSFTTITEKTSPDILARMLHRYFTEMTEEIFSTDGTLDKFIGDAIMAFWGAPLEGSDHPERAVRAAMGMMRRLKGLQEQFRTEGFPEIDIGIGIHTGTAIVGNMGSEKRFDYTIIGDTVNLASRLEGLNKEYKTRIIVSEATESRLPPDIQRKLLGEVTVKGKTVPVRIFEIIT